MVVVFPAPLGPKAEAFPGQNLEIEVIDGDHVPIDLAEAAERECRGGHAEGK